MSATNWILYLALAGLLAGLAIALYMRREPGGRGRVLAAALRAGAIALALLLVFDPWLPGFARGPRGEPAVVLDDSWSMRLPADAAGGTRWDAALRSVAALDVERVTLTSGRSVEREALATLIPDGAGSRIVPALRAALESGALRTVVVSDGGVTDLEEAARLLEAAGASARVVQVGGDAVGNAAVAGVQAPLSARAGEVVTVRVDVAALGMEGEPLGVVLSREGEPLARGVVRAPADGRTASVDLAMTVRAAEAGARLALEARVVPPPADPASGRTGDVLAEDDVRPFFIDVEERPRGIVLVSLRPDWEPRFLLPVLERSSGLSARGYIRTPEGGWLTLGTGASAAQQVSDAVVRADLRSASVAVLHGVGEGAPAWVRESRTHARVIVFPAPGVEARGWPAPLGALAAAPLEAGDWYVEPRPPASPVAALLATLTLDELPPLTSLRTGSTPPGAWVPLSARRDRRGAARPVAVAGRSGEQRWVVATGSGYWRWALRGGEPRRAYALFWSSLVGWLMEDMAGGGVAAVRPDAAVVERGRPIVWQVSGNADSLRLRLDVAGTTSDTVVPIADDGSARTAPLDPGLVSWSARAGEASASGQLAVAAWSPEFVRPARDLSSLPSNDATMRAPTEGRRRLHAQTWPWILLVVLLCGEWIARRRLGLR